jgi:hypothetical protein
MPDGGIFFKDHYYGMKSDPKSIGASLVNMSTFKEDFVNSILISGKSIGAGLGLFLAVSRGQAAVAGLGGLGAGVGLASLGFAGTVFGLVVKSTKAVIALRKTQKIIPEPKVIYTNDIVKNDNNYN